MRLTMKARRPKVPQVGDVGLWWLGAMSMTTREKQPRSWPPRIVRQSCHHNFCGRALRLCVVRKSRDRTFTQPSTLFPGGEGTVEIRHDKHGLNTRWAEW